MDATRTCTVTDCDRNYHARGMCLTHYLRWRRSGNTDDPAAAKRKRPTSYTGIHAALKRDRGPASLHACVDCGGTADAWSYDYADPDERTAGPKDRFSPYSLNQDHYQPRCQDCHNRFDLQQRLIRNPPPTERPCRTCGVVKSLNDFARDGRRLDGHASRCKDCDRAHRRAQQPRRRKSNRQSRAELLEEIDRLNAEIERLLNVPPASCTCARVGGAA